MFNRFSALRRSAHWISLILMLALIAACAATPEPTEEELTAAAEAEPVEPTPDPEATPTPNNETLMVTRAAEAQLDNIVVVPPSAEVERVTLDIALIGRSLQTLDPQQVESENEILLAENMFAGLTRLHPATADIEPILAESWEMSADGTRWTFTLRDEIFWVRPVATTSNVLLNNQPTLQESQALRPILAEDFVFSLQRACDPESAATNVFVLYIIQGCQARHLGVEEGETIPPFGVTAPDSKTVVFELTEPAAYFLSLTTIPALRPVPAEIISESNSDWSWPDDSDEIVSSGPYLFDPQSIRGTQLVLQRNPFWPFPYEGNIEVVNLFQFDSSLDSYPSWQQRNLDVTRLPESVREDVMIRSPQRIVDTSDHAVFYTAFNFESPVFQNDAVRRAFSAAINRQEIIDEVYGEQGIAMRHFAPPGSVGAPPADQVGIGYDPDYARQQLVEGGINTCLALPTIRYMVSSSDDALFQAELIREMWVEELGCDEEKIIIEQVQFGTLLASTRQNPNTPRPDVWDLGWAAYYPDAHNWFHDVLHCTESDNRNKRPCSEIDTLIDQAAAAPQADRIGLYRSLETDLFGRAGVAPIAPLYATSNSFLRQTWLVFTPATFGGEQFDRYTIDWELKKLEKQQ